MLINEIVFGMWINFIKKEVIIYKLMLLVERICDLCLLKFYVMIEVRDVVVRVFGKIDN